ncbi:MAG: LamG-like jellyroll fold domain-containing protein [Coraliomargarita sp.]
MKTVRLVVALLTQVPLAVCAEGPWRFIQLTDWHAAEAYVQPERYPGFVEQNLADLRMLKQNYGGELILMPGDSNIGHWDTPAFIQSFNPQLTPAEAILRAGELCYGGMVDAFSEAGYSTILMAVGDHEVGDNPWPVGSDVSKHQAEFRQAFTLGFNMERDGGRFKYEEPIGAAPSRPLGTQYESTAFAYRHKNVLFVTVDAFYQKDPEKKVGLEGSVTGAVLGQQLAWLDLVLSEARKDSSIQHIFVQSHLPVLQPVRRVNSSGMLMDGEMDSAFWKTLRKHRVDIYFAGEVHSNTVTKDPESDLVQVVTRGRLLANFVTVDVSDTVIELTLYNQTSSKASDGEFEEYGKLVIDKSSEQTSFRDEGEFTFLDRNAPMLHFDFEEKVALNDRIVLGLSFRKQEHPRMDQVTIQRVSCAHSFPNRGAFGRNYDAQHANVELATDGPRGKSGVFNESSRMAVYGAGPHGHGNIISYALWMKTTSQADMVLINVGRSGRKGFLNLNLKDGKPEVLLSGSSRSLANSQALNDGKWHHIAVSMPGKDCRLSELQFYVDGEPVEHSVTQDSRISVTKACKLSVGGLGHGSPKFADTLYGAFALKPFTGALDEVSVWARPLTAEDITALVHGIPDS